VAQAGAVNMGGQKSIFGMLPGIEVPVAEISRTLSNIWEADSASGPSEFRASQMNLILHFGKGTQAEEAREIFEVALRFSQRYPSRIVALCPEDHSQAETLLTSKIFSECYIGKSGRDRSCVEAIVLAYPTEGKSFLENQVSILLEPDLPTYYWQHHFQAAGRVKDYGFFLNIARRVVFDSRRESSDVREIEWPRPEIVRDLAYARLLPVRQSIGQFLSGFAPEELATGLQKVNVCHTAEMEAESCALLGWIRNALEKCAQEGLSPDVKLGCSKGCKNDYDMEVRFTYEDGRFFCWYSHWEQKSAEIEADFGRGRIHLPAALKLLRPEAALAEAFFF